MTNDTINTSVHGILESCNEQDKRRLIQAAKILIEWLESQHPDSHSQHMVPNEAQIGSEESQEKQTKSDIENYG